MKKKILITLSVLVLLGLAACASTKTETFIESEPVDSNGIMETSYYMDYSQDRLDEYLGKKPFALFFHATWCPTCRRLDAEIKKGLNTLNGAVILKIDYDTEIEKKKQYSIRIQDTTVFFDENGNVVSTKIGARFRDYTKFFNN